MSLPANFFLTGTRLQAPKAQRFLARKTAEPAQALRCQSGVSDEWLAPADRSVPMRIQKLEVAGTRAGVFVPEGLIGSINESTISEEDPAPVHEWASLNLQRSLVFRNPKAWLGTGWPEERLYQFRDRYKGVLMPHTLGSTSGRPPYSIGTITILTPPVESGDGTATLAYATAMHNFPPSVEELVYKLGASSSPQIFDPLASRDSGVDEDFLVQDLWTAFNEPGEAPNLFYQVAIAQLMSRINEQGQFFPFQFQQTWWEALGYDILTPTHRDPKMVAITGVVGDNFKVSQATGSPARQAAVRRLPANVSVVSPGDVLSGGNGRYFFHRCSVVGGCRGGAARHMFAPQLLHGIHLGTPSGRPFNVAVSCNHPAFVCAYAKRALPLLAVLGSDIYQTRYQLPALQNYLRHHEVLLREQNLWGSHLCWVHSQSLYLSCKELLRGAAAADAVIVAKT
ncbi:hypothetical protein WJX73_006367 [Symbiochloris irregularis]|uniref:Uncharacterized protein n=1 Tax=Symbiochloris irregularis TaxID=706552 RepID=A0AAW1NP25_9CHLO